MTIPLPISVTEADLRTFIYLQALVTSIYTQENPVVITYRLPPHVAPQSGHCGAVVLSRRTGADGKVVQAILVGPSFPATREFALHRLLW
jgi:hypothetical protein